MFCIKRSYSCLRAGLRATYQSHTAKKDVFIRLFSAEHILNTDSGNEIEEQLNEMENQRSLRIGIIGVPNAGKSVLTNTLVGSKVSAVSSKTNTTQRQTLGVRTEGNVQLLFLDTPGVIDQSHQKTDATRARVRGAWGTALSCDRLLFLIDAFRQVEKADPRVLRLLKDILPELERLGQQRQDVPPADLLLNKIDQFQSKDMSSLDQLRDSLNALHHFDNTFYISAKYHTGCDALLERLSSHAVQREWQVEEGVTTDQSTEDLAAEIVREEIFRRVNKELPYIVEIRNISMKKSKLKDNQIKFKQEVLVDTAHQAAIIVGKGGKVLDSIKHRAEETLKKTLKCPVKLVISVKQKR